MRYETHSASIVETYGTNVFSLTFTFNMIKIISDAMNVSDTFIGNDYIWMNERQQFTPAKMIWNNSKETVGDWTNDLSKFETA